MRHHTLLQSMVGTSILFVLLASCYNTAATPIDTGHYTSYDDASWAVVTDKLTKPETQALYDTYMDNCRTSCKSTRSAYNLCTSAEEQRLQMNTYQPRSMRNYTKLGFQKIRAPDSVIKLLTEFWENNKDMLITEWEHPTPYHNIWEAPPSIVRVDNASLVGGGPHVPAAISNAARVAMEAWTGLPQAASSVYGIRVYHNNSILAPHVDRMPLISSAIINVAQDVDEPWYLEVYGHDGVAHNVTMEPGDLVLYESHSVIHGRPFPMRGRYYANIFVHFEPLGAPRDVVDKNVTEDLTFPPYLIRGSTWESEWRSMYPEGWQVFHDIIGLVSRGDLATLRYLGQMNATKLIEHDESPAEWRPIHEAARQGYTEIAKFLIEELGVDVNVRCNAENSATPLDLARKFAGKDHAVTRYLERIGGVAYSTATSTEEVESEEEL